MKLLIVLLVVLAGVWLWRRGRRLPPTRDPARPSGQAALPMGRCARCGVHVPGDMVVHGRQGGYCCAAHRQEAEGA